MKILIQIKLLFLFFYKEVLTISELNRSKYNHNTIKSKNSSIYEIKNFTEDSLEIDLIQIKGNSFLHKFICKTQNCEITADNYLYLHYNKEILDSYIINNQQILFLFKDDFSELKDEKILIAVYCDDEIDCEYYIGTHNKTNKIIIPENIFCMHMINNINLTYIFNENKNNKNIYVKIMGLFGKFKVNFKKKEYNDKIILNGNSLIFENEIIQNEIVEMNINNIDGNNCPILFFVFYSYEKNYLMMNNILFSSLLFNKDDEKKIIFNVEPNKKLQISLESKGCEMKITDEENYYMTNFFNQIYSNSTINLTIKINSNEENKKEISNFILNENNNENTFCFIQGYSTLLDNNLDNILVLNENIQNKIILEETNKKLSKYLTLIIIPYNSYSIEGYSFKINMEPNSNISLTLSIKKKNINYFLMYSRVIKLDSIISKYCEINEICLIKVEIENKMNQISEISLKLITRNEITYLEKDKVISDRIENSNLVFYREISSNEKGLITGSTVNISPFFKAYFIPIALYNKSNVYPFDFEKFNNNDVEETNKDTLTLNFDSKDKNCSNGCILFLKSISIPIEPFIHLYYKKNNEIIYIKENTDILGNINFNKDKEDDIFILKNYSSLTSRFILTFDSLNEKLNIEDLTENKTLIKEFFIPKGKDFINIKSNQNSLFFNHSLKITISKINKNSNSNRPYVFKIIPQILNIDFMYITSFTTEICIPETTLPHYYYQCNFIYHPIEGSFIKNFIISAFEEGYGYKKYIGISILNVNDNGRTDFDIYKRLNNSFPPDYTNKSKSSIEPSFIFYPSDEDKINENFYIFIKIIGTVKNQDFKNFLFFSTNNFNDKNYIINPVLNFEQFYYLYERLNYYYEIDSKENNQFIYHFQINNHAKKIIFKGYDLNEIIDGNFILTISNLKELKYIINSIDEPNALVNTKIWKDENNQKYENLPFNKENKIILFDYTLPLTFTIKLDYTFQFTVNFKIRNSKDPSDNTINNCFDNYELITYLYDESNINLTKKNLTFIKLKLETMFIISSLSINPNETYTHLFIQLKNTSYVPKIEILEINILSYTINRNRFFLQEKSYFYGSMNTSENNSTILYLRPILGKPISIEFSSCNNILYSIRIYHGYTIYVKKEIKTLKKNLINGKLNFKVDIDESDLPDLKIEIRALNSIPTISYYAIKYRIGEPINFKIDRELNLNMKELTLNVAWGEIFPEDISQQIKPIYYLRIYEKETMNFSSICYQEKSKNEFLEISSGIKEKNLELENYYASLIAYFIYNNNEEFLLSFENCYLKNEMEGKYQWISVMIIYILIFCFFSIYYLKKIINKKYYQKNNSKEIEKFINEDLE